MQMLTEVEKGLMLARAGYQCEYCKRLLSDVTYQIEHIWPKARGGSNDQQNVAISCQRCNKNKGDHTEWLDPFTGQTFPLFHPRIMKWEDHFIKKRSEVTGSTSIGRATAALLFRSTSQYLPPDLQWDKIESLHENQSIYYFLNHLRYRRLRNEFDTLYKQLVGPLPLVDISPNENKLIKFAKDLLLLELYFTRSCPKDVTIGINHAHQVLLQPDLPFFQKNEIRSILSILYQQRATLNFEAGDIEAARMDQSKAYEFYKQADHHEADSTEIPDHPQNLGVFLRSHTVHAKYMQIEMSADILDNCFGIISELDPFYSTSHYSYLTDLIMLNRTPPVKLLEKLYEHTTNTLSMEGYGTATDQAKLVTLRRRWWILHFFLEERPQYDMLISDLKLWKRITMFNEIRELQSYVMRTRPLLNDKNYKDIVELISGADSK